MPSRLLFLIPSCSCSNPACSYWSVSVALPSLLYDINFRTTHDPEGAFLRDVVYPILVLESVPNLVRQLPRHLDRIDALDITIQALPFCHPRLRRVGQRDETLEDLGRAALDLVWGTSKVEELFAIGAALVAKALDDQEESAVVPGKGGRGLQQGKDGEAGSSRLTLEVMTMEQTMQARR